LIHVVDDEPSIRHALSWLLVELGLPHRCYPDAESFLDQVDERTRGVLLLDVQLPGMSGLELLRGCVPRPVAMPILVLTAHASIPMAVEAVQHGAVTLLRKPLPTEELSCVLRSALSKEAAAWPTLAENLELVDALDHLTPREQEIMGLVTRGMSNQDVATTLSISPRTVEIHRSRVLRKTSSNNAADLARRLSELEHKGFFSSTRPA